MVLTAKSRAQRAIRLTQQDVRAELSYDPETGELRWREARAKRREDLLPATAPDRTTGYMRICFKGRRYYFHRIIWLWWYGYWPEHEIDHINRDKTDNRLGNLREVTTQCNSRNCGMQKTNKSGVKGVCFAPHRNKWVAYAGVWGQMKTLGYHESFVEAVAHRLAAEQCLDWTKCDQDSSAYKYLQKEINK